MKTILLLPLILLSSCTSLAYDHPSPLQKTREVQEQNHEGWYSEVTYTWGDKKPEKEKKESDRKKLRNTVKWIKKNRKSMRPIAKLKKKKKKEKKDEKPTSNDSNGSTSK